MHIFLTGEIHVGKSTAINKVLERREYRLGGFKTVSAPVEVPDAYAGVYITPASGTEGYLDKEHLVGIRWGGDRFTAFPEAFDGPGADILEKAGEYDLILMDELGVMEGRSQRFTGAVLEKLKGGVPVLGVIKPVQSPLLDAVRNSPNVTVINVTKENRDSIPDIVEELLLKEPVIK